MSYFRDISISANPYGDVGTWVRVGLRTGSLARVIQIGSAHDRPVGGFQAWTVLRYWVLDDLIYADDAAEDLAFA